MNVRIRLRPTKSSQAYQFVVLDSRKPRNSRYLDRIGTYTIEKGAILSFLSEAEIRNRTGVNIITLNFKRLAYWLGRGAQFTPNSFRLLYRTGAWNAFINASRREE